MVLVETQTVKTIALMNFPKSRIRRIIQDEKRRVIIVGKPVGKRFLAEMVLVKTQTVETIAFMIFSNDRIRRTLQDERGRIIIVGK